MGETGDPCGMPFWTGFISPLVPSMHIAACLSVRKLFTHLTYSSGIFLCRSCCSSRLWLTKSKYPLMSNVSAVVTLPWFQADCMSLMKVMMASFVDELDLPPNWLGGTRSYLPARNVSLLAIILSSTFPRHSSSVMRR